MHAPSSRSSTKEIAHAATATRGAANELPRLSECAASQLDSEHTLHSSRILSGALKRERVQRQVTRAFLRVVQLHGAEGTLGTRAVVLIGRRQHGIHRSRAAVRDRANEQDVPVRRRTTGGSKVLQRGVTRCRPIELRDQLRDTNTWRRASQAVTTARLTIVSSRSYSRRSCC